MPASNEVVVRSGIADAGIMGTDIASNTTVPTTTMPPVTPKAPYR